MDTKYRIIVVDDVEIMHKLVKGCLQDKYDIYSAYSANEVLDMVKYPEVEYHLVLLDLNMPERNGFYVLKKFKSRGIDIPVIVFTASDDKDDFLKALKLGAVDYLVKDVAAELLDYKIKKNIEKFYNEN